MYQVREYGDGWELENDSGEVVESGSYPLTTPDDLIDAILADMGVGDPQREALSVLFKREWEFPDRE